MNFWAFANNHPVLTFLLSAMALTALGGILSLPFRAFNRLMRHLNIKAHGWPPAHCDADGEFRDKPEESE